MPEEKNTKSIIVTCPTCQKSVDWAKAKPWSPFCSERCKQIDLGAWAGEEHRIPGEKAPQEPDNSEEDF